MVDGLLGGGEDPELARALAGGAIVSFPHTSLADAGPLQARTVDALLRSGVERVIALGVLHSGGVAPYRTALDRSQSDEVRLAAYGEVVGGWLVPETGIDTPFGDLPTLEVPEEERVPVRLDRHGLLADEFSLDTFCALVKRAAALRDVRPPAILRLFVGPTRHPIDGSFAVAERLAAWVGSVVAADGRPAAIVTTGDLVHYGTAYGDPEADPAERLAAMESRFRRTVERLLEAGLVDGDWAGAHRLASDVLRSDQRAILPVVSAILGPARARILHFELSDYSGILGVSPPCRVASVLSVYERRDPARGH